MPPGACPFANRDFERKREVSSDSINYLLGFKISMRSLSGQLFRVFGEKQ